MVVFSTLILASTCWYSALALAELKSNPVRWMRNDILNPMEYDILCGVVGTLSYQQG